MRIHKFPRKSGDELGQQQHHGAEQRVLRGRIADVGERGQIGDERGRGNAAGQVVCRDDPHQRLHIVAHATEPDKQQIGERTQGRPQHEHTHDAQPRRQHTTHKRAHQGHDDAVQLGHAGHFAFGKTHVHIKRVGHDAHDHVTDAVNRDQRQQQHRLPAVAQPKIGKGLDHRALEPLGHIARRRKGCRHRFGRSQNHPHAWQHAQCHDQVGRLPSRLRIAGRLLALGQSRDPQHARPGPDHGQAITRLVAGRQGGLGVHLGRLNAVGVQRNVLRG